MSSTCRTAKDVKQHMDLYFPVQKTSNAPVLVFLHGGGFREGDRKQYGYVAEAFAKQGILTVVASYRLTPGFTIPITRGREGGRDLDLQQHRKVRRQSQRDLRHAVTPPALSSLQRSASISRGWMRQRCRGPHCAASFPSVAHTTCAMRSAKSTCPRPKRKKKASALLHVNAPAPLAIVVYGSQEERLKNLLLRS
jgi:hypothetical protein